MRHFQFIFKTLQFSIYTDHKPSVHAMAKTGELWSAQQHRHLSTFSEYTIDVQYISGKNNVVADSLAVSNNAVSLGIDYTAMAKSKTASIHIQIYKTAVTRLNIITTKVD